MSNKKEQIFNAVITHIKEEGFLNHLTISEIAKKADVGKGTVYEYFNSKDEVIAETIIYMMEETSHKIISRQDKITNFKDALYYHIKTLMHLFIENSSFHTMLMSQDIGGLINESLKQKIMKKLKELKMKYREYLGHILQQGVKEGSIQEVNDAFTVVCIGNLIVTSIMHYIHNCDDITLDKDELVDKVLQIILKILT